MTTIVYDRRTKTFAADSQNTDSCGTTYKVSKIEHIGSGWMFAGSGHLYTINQCKEWARMKFKSEHTPDWGYYLDDPEERSFSCIIVDPTGTEVYIIDDELQPFQPLDDYVSVGAGSWFALGALAAGATAKEAVEIACKLDTNSFEPVEVYQWPTPETEKKAQRRGARAKNDPPWKDA